MNHCCKTMSRVARAGSTAERAGTFRAGASGGAVQGRVVVASAAALPEVLSTDLLPAFSKLVLHMVMIQVACAAHAIGKLFADIEHTAGCCSDADGVVGILGHCRGRCWTPLALATPSTPRCCMAS